MAERQPIAIGEVGVRRKRSASRTSEVRVGRWMVGRAEPLVVFLFGMRLNRVGGLPRWLWGFGALRRVLADLEGHHVRGFLAGHVYLAGRSVIVVQYWESFDALDAYARDHALPHRGAWQRYLRVALNDPAMGLWHETYLVAPGSWEGVYVNMPRWGAGAAAELRELRAGEGSARDRLHQRQQRQQRQQRHHGEVDEPSPPA
jgi:hypothetical protein